MTIIFVFIVLGAKSLCLCGLARGSIQGPLVPKTLKRNDQLIIARSIDSIYFWLIAKL